MDKTIELLKKSDALLEGHFLLSSGNTLMDTFNVQN